MYPAYGTHHRLHNISENQWDDYVVSTADTDGLALQCQGISRRSAEYALTCFQLFMSEVISGICEQMFYGR